LADQNFRVKRGLEVGIGATVLVAQSSGNIGINSTAPEERLTVYHDGDAALFRNQDYSVSVYTTTPRIRFGTDTAYAGYMEIGAYTSVNNLDTKNRDFKLFSTAVDPILYAQEDTGNVGIGTDAPSQKLDVYGGSAAIRNIGSESFIEVGAGQNSNQYAYIDFIGDTTYTDYGLRLLRGNGGANSWSELIHRGTGTFYLSAKDAGSISLRTQNTDRVRIDSSGNVGIGTDNPQTKLSVSSGGPAFEVYPGLSNTITLTAFDRNVSDWYDMRLRAENILFSPQGSEKVRITSSGDVGIGITNPSEKLDVIGTVKLDGLVFGVGTTVTSIDTDLTTVSANDDTLASAKAIKDYVVNLVTAQDLDFADGIGGTGAVDLDSQSLTIAGTSNEIETSASGQTLTIGLPNDVTIGQDLTVTRDVQINRNLNVDGNITIGGTSATLFTQTLTVADSDLILGVRTDGLGNDISNDTTANHGGIAIASTEGNPLITIVNPGAGETLPATYKKIMWFKSGSFSGLGTDAWLSNYAVGIGSIQVPNGVRLAAGDVHITENDISKVRDVNASGIVTATQGISVGSGNTVINSSGNVYFDGTPTITNQDRGIYWSAYDKESVGDFTDLAHIKHTVNSGGLTGAVLEIKSHNDANDGVNFVVNSNASGVRINGNAVWHEGNDGSGSGLDADTLDTLQATSFLRSDTDDTMDGILTLGGTSVSGNEGGELKLTQAPNSTLQGNEVVIDSYLDRIRFFEGGSPFKGAYLNIAGLSASIGSRILTTDDEGSGNGLDADTLDGIEASSFLRSDAADTGTGLITLTNGLNVTGGNIGIGTDNPSHKLHVYGSEVAAFGPGATNGNTLLIGADIPTNTDADTAHIELTNGNIHIDTTEGAYGIYLNYFGGQGGTVFGNGNGASVGKFSNSGVLTINTTSLTGTASQNLQVSGGAYVSGALGIGVTNPSAKLDVNGDININNNVIISNNGGTTNIDHIWHDDNNGVGYGQGGVWNFVSDSTYKATGNSAIRAGAFANMADTGTANQKLQISGGAYFSQAVGIGYTAPGFTLAVNGSGYFNTNLIGTNVLAGTQTLTGTANQKLQVDGGAYVSGNLGIGATNPELALDIQKGKSVNQIRLKPSDGNIDMRINSAFGNADVASITVVNSYPLVFHTANQERVRITSAGRVGIGTNSPKHKLNVYNETASSAGGILVQNVTYSANEDRPYLIVGTKDWTGATTNWNTYGIQHRIKSNSGGSARITIDTFNGEAFCVENSGDVGIGTNSPSQKLDVNGALRLRGALYDGNNQAGSSGQVLSSTATGIDWIDAAPSNAIAGISIYDETSLVGTANSVSTLYFVGPNVTATSVGSAATITVADYVSNSGIATNLKGGTAGDIPYQTAADTTTFLADPGAGGNGYMLTWDNGNTRPAWAPAAPATAITGLSVRDEGSLQGSANSVTILDIVGDNVSASVGSGIATITVSDTPTFDTLNVTGVSTFQSDIHLGDDDELTFGDDNDLFIYSNGTNGVIRSSGGANINYRSSTHNFRNQGGTEQLATFTANGSVDLYYDDSKKFETIGTGVSISNGASTSATIAGPSELIIDPAAVGDDTGIVRIKGDLYVDGTTTQINSTSLEIADFIVGIASTATTDSLADGAGIQIGPDNTFLYQYNSGTNPSLQSSENLSVATGKVYQIGTTERLSANTLSLGTGTTIHSPSSNVLSLGVNGKSNIRVENTGDVTLNLSSTYEDEGILKFGRQDGVDRSHYIRVYNSATTASNYMKFDVHNGSVDGSGVGRFTNVLTLLGNGNVGIGTDNPTHRLVVDGSGTANTGTTIARFRNSSSQNRIDIIDETTTGTKPPGILSPSASYGLGLYAAVGPVRIYSGGTTTERARFDDSGNLLINRTSATGTSSQPLQVTGGAYVSGDVGIGDTNPQFKLSVNGLSAISNAQSQLLLHQATNTPTVIHRNDGSNYYILLSGASATPSGSWNGLRPLRIDLTTGRIQSDNGQFFQGNTLIGSGTETGTASQPLQVTGGAYVSGNLGIGNTNPTSKLHIFATTNGEEVLRIGGSHGNSGSIQGITHIGLGYWTTGTYSPARITVQEATSGDYRANLLFSTRGASSDTAPTERMRISYDGNVGINSTAPTEKLDVVGTVKATDFNTTSDQNLKTNIQTIENPLDKIVQIRGVNFEWKENNKPSAGVIAQEVEKVLPQLVNGEGTKTVNYNGLIGLLIEAVKAQQEEINMLKERLK